MISFNDKIKQELNSHKNNNKNIELKERYLSCGHINDPSKDRHLEFALSSAKLANDTLKKLADNGISAKLSTRSKKYLVYVKSEKDILAILKLLEVKKASALFLESIKNRSIKSSINRQVNFEAANIKKTAVTGVGQIDDINKILKHIKKHDIDEKLYQVMKIRFENPDASYSELVSIIGNISKSTLNRRFRQIKELAERF